MAKELSYRVRISLQERSTDDHGCCSPEYELCNTILRDNAQALELLYRALELKAAAPPTVPSQEALRERFFGIPMGGGKMRKTAMEARSSHAARDNKIFLLQLHYNTARGHWQVELVSGTNA
jgi:hypothetical protein